MPIIGIAIILNANIYTHLETKHEIYIYSIVFFFTVVLPISFLPLLKIWKVISSVELSTRKERFIPQFVATVCFILAHYFLVKVGAPRAITMFTLSISVLGLLSLFITMFWKVSIHMIAIGGIVALVFMLFMKYNFSSFYLFSFLILLSGAIASSRLYLKSHNIWQVLVGYSSGFSVVFFVYLSFIR